MFIVAWVMLLVVAFGFPFSTKYSKGFVALFSLFPWTVLGKGIRDLASATTGTFICLAFRFPFSTNYSKGFVVLFSLFPWTELGKGIRDLASATTGGSPILLYCLPDPNTCLHVST